MLKSPVRICILGGGFGGLYTALHLSRCARVKRKNCQIILVEPKDRFLFTPLLYELITGELQRWEIAPSYQKILAKTPVRFCQQTVQAIDFRDRNVNLENHETLTYDYLVLAVGSQNRWANVPGVATHALTFRTLSDVERLQSRLRSLEMSERQTLRLAIIGGGPNGVELACKLADRLGKRGQVWLIDIGETILKGFSVGVQAAAYRALRVRQIQVNLETSVQSIEAEQITLLHHNQETRLLMDLVLWTAGTQPKEWLRQLECQQNEQGRLLTHSTLQLIDHPEVFALGDIAEIYNGRQFVPATAQVAYQQASRTAKNIQAALQGKRLKPFYYLHLGDMLTLGKGAAVVSSFFLNIEGVLAALIRRLVYIQRLPTLRHRLQVLKHLLKRAILKLLNWLSYLLRKVFTKKVVRFYPKSSTNSQPKR